MNPDFFQIHEPTIHIGALKPLIGIFIVFIGTFIGVEIRVGKEDEEK